MLISLNAYPVHKYAMESISCLHNACVSAEALMGCAANNAIIGLAGNVPLHLLEDHIYSKIMTDREYEMYQEDVRLFTDIYNEVYWQLTSLYLPELYANIDYDRKRIARIIVQHGMLLFQVNKESLHG